MQWVAISSSRGSSGLSDRTASPVFQVDSLLMDHQGRPFMCNWQSTKGEPPTLLTVRSDGEFRPTNEINAIGAKVLVKQPRGPPTPADVIAQRKGHSILVMIPEQERWKYVPLTHCYSHE